MRSLASGSSSTIRTRVRGVVMMDLCDAERGGLLLRHADALEWNLDQDRESAVFVGELEPIVPSVQAVEPGARVRQPDAGAQGLERPYLEAAAVVADLHPQPPVVVAPGGDLHRVAAVAPGNPVLDR